MTRNEERLLQAKHQENIRSLDALGVHSNKVYSFVVKGSSGVHP